MQPVNVSKLDSGDGSQIMKIGDLFQGFQLIHWPLNQQFVTSLQDFILEVGSPSFAVPKDGQYVQAKTIPKTHFI